MRKIRCITGTLSGISSSVWSVIDISDETMNTICIHRIILVRTSGSGTTFYPTIKNTSTGSGTQITTLYQGTATAVADPFDVTDIMGFGVTDADGKVYLNCNPDAGSDNAYQYIITVEVF